MQDYFKAILRLLQKSFMTNKESLLIQNNLKATLLTEYVKTLSRLFHDCLISRLPENYFVFNFKITSKTT